MYMKTEIFAVYLEFAMENCSVVSSKSKSIPAVNKVLFVITVAPHLVNQDRGLPCNLCPIFAIHGHYVKGKNLLRGKCTPRFENIHIKMESFKMKNIGTLALPSLLGRP